MSERDEASKDRAGLYVHFPFCREKCPYCHFASVPYHKEIADIWRKGLAREARFYYPQDFIFDSLYFGGGTPSLLSPAEVLGVREILNKNFRLEINEFTLEANPDIKDPDIRGDGGNPASRGSASASSPSTIGSSSFSAEIIQRPEPPISHPRAEQPGSTTYPWT